MQLSCRLATPVGPAAATRAQRRQEVAGDRVVVPRRIAASAISGRLQSGWLPLARKASSTTRRRRALSVRADGENGAKEPGSPAAKGPALPITGGAKEARAVQGFINWAKLSQKNKAQQRKVQWPAWLAALAGLVVGLALAFAWYVNFSPASTDAAFEAALQVAKATEADVGAAAGSAAAAITAAAEAVLPQSKLALLLSTLGKNGLLLAGLLCSCVFFAMSEISITSLWPWRIRELAKEEGSTDRAAFEAVMADPTRFLTTILIGTTICTTACNAILADTVSEIFGPAALGASATTISVLWLLFVEITPKSIAVQHARQVAKVIIAPLSVCAVLLYPVGQACTWLSERLLGAVGVAHHTTPLVSASELRLMVGGAERSGAIEEEEQRMIENVLDFEDAAVKEVMTPLVDVVAIERGATLLDLQRLWQRQPYSRIPVYDTRVDNVVGIAYSMDVVDYADTPSLLTTTPVGAVMRPADFFVPKTMPVFGLLREFRARRVHLAVVVNEYGGASGVVALEDVLERIVGAIYDEEERPAAAPQEEIRMAAIAPGVWEADARLAVGDAAAAMGAMFPPGDYERLSGYACAVFGRIPAAGDSKHVRLAAAPPDGDDAGDDDEAAAALRQPQDYRLTVTAATPRCVTTLLLERVTADVAAAAAKADRDASRHEAEIDGKENGGGHAAHAAPRVAPASAPVH